MYVPRDIFKACPEHWDIYCGDAIRALECSLLNLRVLSYRLLNVMAAGGGDVCRNCPDRARTDRLWSTDVLHSNKLQISSENIYLCFICFATDEVMPGHWIIQVQVTLFGILTWHDGNFCHILSQSFFWKAELWSRKFQEGETDKPFFS